MDNDAESYAPVMPYLTVKDGPAVLAFYDRAMALGAKAIQPPVIKPWGELSARVRDPAGHVWAVGGPQGYPLGPGALVGR